MKKTLVIVLAIVMALTCLSVVACKTNVVRVVLHDASESPRIAFHTIGEDDLSAVSGENQSFKGWFYDKELTDPFVIIDEIADGTHLYAKFEPVENNQGGGNQGGNQGSNQDKVEKVTLTLNPNYNGATVTNIELDKNAAYKLPVVTRTGYALIGWFTQQVDGIKWTDATPVSESITLYAQWTENGGGNQGNAEKVMLTLNPNYAGATVTSVELNKNATYTLPVISQAGHTFNGWFTQPVGGTKWTNSTPVTVHTTLYAQWTQDSQGGNTDPTPVDLSEVFNKYSNISKWNFAVSLVYGDGSESYEDYYEYNGYVILNRYVAQDENTYTDYLDMSGSSYYFYADNGNGTYTKYAENTDEFEKGYSYLTIIDMSRLGSYTFVDADGYYTAQNPGDAGKAVIGEYTSFTWSSFAVYIANGNVTKIVAGASDGWIYTFELSDYGAVDFTLPEATEGGSTGGTTVPTEPTGTMENQIYNSETFDNSNLQDKLLINDKFIGLPSTGNINALVIPVQFVGNTITQTQLDNLNVALNGTSEQTGWESVKTFYQKSSYGKLNLTFDIQDVYQAKNNSSYYEKVSNGLGYETILEEALAYYESLIDLTRYDTNGDGYIDAVYLIYSASVDYDNADFYWAYVTKYSGNTKYDGKNAGYLLFAGFDFMGADPYSSMPEGMIINAETYIHETGHLLGLDDYYDYEKNQGGNQGLGGADMMDFNKGDHGVYSKIMLGWLDPTVITSTQTITIKSSQAEGSAILIPLNFNNSYFCEYLLIDLYSAQGLNALHSSESDTILYGGAAYGVRIYHVSSSINNPYSNDYYSLTDYNNSTTNIPLIKLIEADGKTSTSSTNNGGWASESDLWQAGDSFGNEFPQYMRNDGKALNFNISIDSVTAESATVTITYNVAA